MKEIDIRALAQLHDARDEQKKMERAKIEEQCAVRVQIDEIFSLLNHRIFSPGPSAVPRELQVQAAKAIYVAFEQTVKTLEGEKIADAPPEPTKPEKKEETSESAVVGFGLVMLSGILVMVFILGFLLYDRGRLKRDLADWKIEREEEKQKYEKRIKDVDHEHATRK